MSVLQSAKLVLAEATSLGKDALHVYVGLAVMLGVVIAFKKPLSDWRPILAVALASIAGELWDIIDTFSHGGRRAGAATARTSGTRSSGRPCSSCSPASPASEALARIESFLPARHESTSELPTASPIQL
jgi:hypothetical protein